MKWKISLLKPGDHIRVKRDFYYHHGVYFSNDSVFHYTGKNGDSVNHPEEVEVRETSLDFFASSGVIEVASLSIFEKLFFSRSLSKREKLAKSSLGKKDYDILHNNCEDFANFCCYKKKLSSQIEAIKKDI